MHTLMPHRRLPMLAIRTRCSRFGVSLPCRTTPGALRCPLLTLSLPHGWLGARGQDFACVDQSAADTLRYLGALDEEAFNVVSADDPITFTVTLSDGSTRCLTGDGTEVVTFHTRDRFIELSKWVPAGSPPPALRGVCNCGG